MKLRSLMTIFMVSFLFFTSQAEKLTSIFSITGQSAACTEQVYSYSVADDPSVYYEWTITGGAFVSSPVGSYDVDVIWYHTGSISVSAYSDPGLTILVSTSSMAVTVDLLSPHITMDPEVGCLDIKGEQSDRKDEIDCFKACEENVISYFSNGNAGSTFTWDVIGDANILASSSAELKLEWLSVGFGTVTLTETSINGCEAETEICVEVIAKPEALFDVLPGLTVCIGQEVLFNDLSTAVGDADLTAWEWSVSDGTFQAYTESHDFSHIFNSGGLYKVKLRVYNTCGCYDDYIVKIKVIEDEGPDIFCPKVVCPNEKTVLSTNSNCGTYYWAVENGTIVDGLGTSKITVMWDDVPGGVGYVQLATPCGECNIPTVLEIPILGTSLDIDGPLEVCNGDQVTLTVPKIPGTFYSWNIYSFPSSGYIVQTIHNQVIIEVTGTAPITVEVEYYSEIAGCGDGCKGESSHTMIATDPSFITGLENVCVDDTESYSISGPATGNIRVERPDNSVVTISNGGNYTFTHEGVHILTTNNGGCQGAPLLVNAHENPEPVDFIIGETNVCPNIPYTYEAGNDLDGTIYAWSVSGGTPATGVGKEIAVTWDLSGVYSLSVVRMNVKTPNCASDPKFYNITPVSLSPNLTGPTGVCANTSYPYSLDYLDGEEYKWTISAEGQGSVISDPNSNSVNILWNNTTGPATITGSVRKCNVWYDVTLNVLISPVNNVNFTVSDADNTICQNESLTFTADPGYTYTWALDPMFGLPLPTTSSFSRVFTDAGTFNVTLVAKDNCGNISMHSEVITVLPEPPSTLGASSNTIVCDGSGNVVSGSATLVTSIIGGVGGYSFSWSTGASSSSIVVTNTGLYKVTVTNDLTGCTSVESIGISCPSGPPCTMPVANDGTFDFTYDNTTCGEVTFDQTSVTTAPGWSLASSKYIHVGDNAFNQSGPTYTYSSFDDAGYYTVTNQLCFSHTSQPSCCKNVNQIVPIPIVAEANANAFCDGTGTYMIQLNDFSSKVSDLTNYDIVWKIDGTVVSTMTASSGTTSVPLGGLTPGATYTVVLEVFVPIAYLPILPSAYQCEFTTTVEIPALPDATFTDNAPVCEDLDVEFVAALNGLNSTYDWSFGDGASLVQTGNTASRKYFGPQVGGYNVVLEVTNAAGCKDTYTSNVNVETNEFGIPTVNVTPSGAICKPNPATLTYSHSGSAIATDYLWSDGATVNPDIVFDAGGYMVTVSDIYGCTSVSSLTPVDIRPAPSAFILGENSYCYDDGLPVELFGYAGPGLTYQWRKRASGGSWISFGSSASISDSGVNVGGSPYEYELTVTDPGTGCSSVTIKSIDIHDAPPQPFVNANVVNCDPHTIKLDASTGISPASFSWSNGDSGTPISVMHGGLYEVTLTDDNGCTSTRLIEVEGAPNLDFFPVGCYVYCEKDLPILYAGPFGNFDYWKLYKDGSGIQSGVGSITNLAINDAGNYFLEVTDNGCVFETGIMEVELDQKKCDEKCEKPCEVKIGKIYPEHVLDCMYDFSFDVFLGECTDIIDYQWTINGVMVPGGAIMSHVFDSPGDSYYICVYVVGEDKFGKKCEDKICIEFTPTCKCDCDILADFDIIQENCEFKFISNVETSKCTEIEGYKWTLSKEGTIFDSNSEESFVYGFGSLQPIEVCLTVYGHGSDMECEDIVCKTIFPCNQEGSGNNNEEARSDGSSLFQSTLTVSPNPVSDILRIESAGPMGTEWHVVVTDVTGRIISNNVVHTEDSLVIMSTAGWKGGIYTVSILDELGNWFNEKVIKID